MSEETHANDTIESTVESVVSWLSLGRDVLVRGDSGSGRSQVLTRVAEELVRRRTNTVLLRAADWTLFGSLVNHDYAPSPLPQGRLAIERVLTQWLTSELGDSRSVLLVDDLDRVDDGSAAVIAAAVQRTGVRTVVSRADGSRRPSTPGARWLLAERSPAEVVVRPLSFLTMSQLVTDRLGGQADVGLTSMITVHSAGNLRVAGALLDAARYVGAVRRRDGIWTWDGLMSQVPVDAVVNGLVSSLDTDELDALELLAWVGTLPADTAAALRPRHVWQSLARRRRVVSFRTAEDVHTLSVAPPALAQALRNRLDHFRREQLAQQLADAAAITPENRWPGEVFEHMLLDDNPTRTEVFWQRSLELDGLLSEQTEVEEAECRAQWRVRPSVAHANALLMLVMRGPAHTPLDLVFETTELDPDDTPGDRALFRMLQVRWLAWKGEDAAAIERFVAEHHEDLAGYRAAMELRERILAAGRHPDSADPDLLDGHPTPTSGDSYIDGWVAVVQASSLLEAGFLDSAVAVCETREVTPEYGGQLQHYLDAIKGVALLARGDLTAAESWERQLFERAYESLDPLGVRAHACVLSEVLVHTGRPAVAWRVINAALGLGPGGPLENTFYRRGLSIAAMLRLRSGDIDTARTLVSELDATPVAYHPSLDSLSVLARTTLDQLEGSAGAESALWRRGAELAEGGLVMPALQHWVMLPPPLTADQLVRMRGLDAEERATFLAPYVQLHGAVVERDLPTARAALEHVQALVTPELVREAVAMLGPEEVPVGSLAEMLPGHQQPQYSALRIEVLSRREREIAAMARRGMTNREIAERLVLSLRTVENHMSHVLSKLGLSSRSELLHFQEF
ncbi:helix-turn-helix transcriptional regulator [Cellulomonas denverensis]|uniref:Response regulator transcription factor n=1 Tax=Cellulomonas denverensis TaxID=264297 RepID=A0A7X6QYC6_9CELL|nr:LuxR C-terminal-related transcriptional regulator [Cellulomonas denverensis]NKY21968.1 response regulator transcription factor [Cellulomonas denverensis]GIG24139.1 hypothetical protein Cde04nite_03830 [Cellulomonas denverensis]